MSRGGRRAVFVKRFDRGAGRRLFARPRISSARCRCSISTIRPSRAPICRSPGLCAGMERRICAIGEELFRRMLFNVLCGNRDDHLKNHALLYEDDGWRLFARVRRRSTNRDRRAGAGDRGRDARRNSDHRELPEPLRRIRPFRGCRGAIADEMVERHATLAARLPRTPRSRGDDRSPPPRLRANSLEQRSMKLRRRRVTSIWWAAIEGCLAAVGLFEVSA